MQTITPIPNSLSHSDDSRGYRIENLKMHVRAESKLPLSSSRNQPMNICLKSVLPHIHFQALYIYLAKFRGKKRPTSLAHPSKQKFLFNRETVGERYCFRYDMQNAWELGQGQVWMTNVTVTNLLKLCHTGKYLALSMSSMCFSLLWLVIAQWRFQFINFRLQSVEDPGSSWNTIKSRWTVLYVRIVHLALLYLLSLPAHESSIPAR